VIDPARALLGFLVVTVLVAALAWPRRGLFARVARLRRLGARVQIEDALKHALNAELAGQAATVDSLAGVLQIPRARAYGLFQRVAELGLARTDASGVALTAEGRAYALKVLRTHRLLERYFADRTGVAPAEWHDLAEAREHGLTDAEVEALAARMGQPAYDPHGDPIPTAAGRLPPKQGFPLGALAAGETAVVVHVEDEPASVFHRLLGLGINLSVPIKMIRAEPNEIEVLVGGISRRLDPLMATAVTVDRVEEAAGHTVLFERLDALRAGEAAEVVQISPAVQGPQRRRLLDLGLLPGTRVVAELLSASGDPMAYRIRGALIALRRLQAQGIYIRRLHPSEGEAAA
jgi:DtxR family Mn-dependent transcriptional regulator